jgi:hypothetical protein
MRRLAAVVALSLACVSPPTLGAPPTIPIWVRSHNGGDIDVYLLCGDRDAELLGVVNSKATGLFEVPASRARCVEGLNFFLVRGDYKRGYWVGPLRPPVGSEIHLTIEKYAGVSTARVVGDAR